MLVLVGSNKKGVVFQFLENHFISTCERALFCFCHTRHSLSKEHMKQYKNNFFKITRQEGFEEILVNAIVQRSCLTRYTSKKRNLLQENEEKCGINLCTKLWRHCCSASNDITHLIMNMEIYISIKTKILKYLHFTATEEVESHSNMARKLSCMYSSHKNPIAWVL